LVSRTVPVTATRATNDKITASGWDAGPVASNTFLTGRPDLSVSGAVTSIANNTLTALTLVFPALVDSDAGFALISPTKYTCQVAGWYLVSGCSGWALNATGQRQTVIRKNGADIRLGAAETNAPAMSMGLASPAVLVQLAVGDYVEVWGFQNSGGALSSGANTLSESSLFAVWISS
jgi:hypothetical protein